MLTNGVRRWVFLCAFGWIIPNLVALKGGDALNSKAKPVVYCLFAMCVVFSFVCFCRSLTCHVCCPPPPPPRAFLPANGQCNLMLLVMMLMMMLIMLRSLPQYHRHRLSRGS